MHGRRVRCSCRSAARPRAEEAEMTETKFDRLEAAYERLAVAIDTAGPDDEALFLTKLVLLLADRLDDARAFDRSVDAALADLPCAAVRTRPAADVSP